MRPLRDNNFWTYLQAIKAADPRAGQSILDVQNLVQMDDEDLLAAQKTLGNIFLYNLSTYFRDVTERKTLTHTHIKDLLDFAKAVDQLATQKPILNSELAAASAHKFRNAFENAVRPYGGVSVEAVIQNICNDTYTQYGKNAFDINAGNTPRYPLSHGRKLPFNTLEEDMREKLTQLGMTYFLEQIDKEAGGNSSPEEPGPL